MVEDESSNFASILVGSCARRARIGDTRLWRRDEQRDLAEHVPRLQSVRLHTVDLHGEGAGCDDEEVLGGLAFETPVQQVHGGAPERTLGHAHGGQRGYRIRGFGDVVEAGDGDVPRYYP